MGGDTKPLTPKEQRKKKLEEYAAKKKFDTESTERHNADAAHPGSPTGAATKSKRRRRGRSSTSKMSKAPGQHKGVATPAAVLQVLYLRYQQKRQAKRWQDIRYRYNNTLDLNKKVQFANDDHAYDDDDADLHEHDSEYFLQRDAAMREKFYTVRESRISADNYHAAHQLLRFSQYTDYPLLYDWRWEAIAGMERNSVVGRGDLVFTDGEGRFAVTKLGVWTRGPESSYPASDAEKVFVRDQQNKSRALRHARIYERLHPRARHVIPMLRTNDGLYQFQEGEWSMYRTKRGWPPLRK